MGRASSTLLLGSALAVLIGNGPAGVRSSESKARLSSQEVCQAARLEAVSRYQSCLTDVVLGAIVRRLVVTPKEVVLT